MKMKALNFYIPISRVDDEQRIVEGYAFENEVVEGEGGVRLKRQAMEDATPEYMRFGNLREMHQASAVGNATAPECGIVWDEKGAKVAYRVDDPVAWEKIKGGTYKGFSVGVRAQVMRGKDVEKCSWIETSLVDRPKDPGALITAYRSDGITDEAISEEMEVEEIVDEANTHEPEVKVEAPESRVAIANLVRASTFSDAMKVVEKEALCDAAFNHLKWRLYDIQWNEEVADKEVTARSLIKEFANYIAPIIARCEFEIDNDLSRLADADTKISSLTERLQAAQEDLMLERAEVKRLKSLPGVSPKAIKYAEALDPKVIERSFTANLVRSPFLERGESLRAEYAALKARLSGPASSAKERHDGSARMLAIKSELSSFGEEL